MSEHGDWTFPRSSSCTVRYILRTLKLSANNMPRSRSRSRSRSPRREERRRSRSPRRRTDEDRPRRIDKGFKWKEKRRDDEGQDGGDSGRLARGYRERMKSSSP